MRPAVTDSARQGDEVMWTVSAWISMGIMIGITFLMYGLQGRGVEYPLWFGLLMVLVAAGCGTSFFVCLFAKSWRQPVSDEE